MTIGWLISPCPRGSPAWLVTQRGPDGELQPADVGRVANRAVTRPGPPVPCSTALSVASSPQIAGGRPPASITMTSPAFATSIAWTGLDQSPGIVRTVTAGPAAREPGTSCLQPLQARLIVRAVGDIGRPNGVQNPPQIVRAAPLEQLGRDRPAGVDRLADVGRRLGGVDGLGDRPADDDDVGTGLDGSGGRLAVDPARYRQGQVGDGPHLAQQGQRVGAEHLGVDRAVHVQPGDAQVGRLSGELDGVGHARADRRRRRSRNVAPPRRTRGWCSRRRRRSTVITLAPALAAASASILPASIVFMSAMITRSPEGRPQLANGVQPFGLDQRRAGLDVVRPAGNGSFRDGNRPREIHEIQRYLQSCPVHSAILYDIRLPRSHHKRGWDNRGPRTGYAALRLGRLRTGLGEEDPPRGEFGRDARRYTRMGQKRSRERQGRRTDSETVCPGFRVRAFTTPFLRSACSACIPADPPVCVGNSISSTLSLQIGEYLVFPSAAA